MGFGFDKSFTGEIYLMYYAPFALIFPVHKLFIEDDRYSGQTYSVIHEQEVVYGGQKGGQIITDRQRAVYKLIKGNPSISRKELSKKLGINESALRKHALKTKGIVKREGPAKGGYWKILI